MIDKIGNLIEEGDILIQGSGEWGLYCYQVTANPEETTRLRVVELGTDSKSALSKQSKYYLNVTKLFGERFDFLELEARLTGLHVV